QPGREASPPGSPSTGGVAPGLRLCDLAIERYTPHNQSPFGRRAGSEARAACHRAPQGAANGTARGCSRGSMGANIAFAGDWVRGCALIEPSMDLNPHHPVWYRGMLSMKEYWSGNYRAAVDEAVKANAPYLFWLQVLLAAAYGQLGD